MGKSDKIYVGGHSGLIGSAIVRVLASNGYNNIIRKTHRELDLIRQERVENFFKTEKPDYVILAAARVGGIHANDTYPAQFLYENLMIQTNVIHAAYLHGVKKLLCFGSACSYPRTCQQPIKEEYLLSGYLEPTNEPYAVAKIAGIKMCQAYNRQYGSHFVCAVPTNAYGPNDNFDPENAHVIPALIKKFHEAKTEGHREVTIWGSGRPLREFIYVDDVADASVFLLENYGRAEIINVGSGEEISIRDLANLVKDAVQYQGKIVFDSSRPDGTPRKALDSSKILSLGWKAQVSLQEGLRKTYTWYLGQKKEAG